jgi:hypothetical protein
MSKPKCQVYRASKALGLYEEQKEEIFADLD